MANKTITYEDLSLTGLIEYYEKKKGPRAKMTLSYLQEVVDVHAVINGPGYGNSPARTRLDEMRKHPRRQELLMKAQKAEQRADMTRLLMKDQEKKNGTSS